MQSPAYKGFFLPKRSSNGPYNNCPKEIPIKKLDNESVTSATVVCKPLAMSGNAGRYMSIEKGPIAVSKPSIVMRWNLLVLRLLLISCQLYKDCLLYTSDAADERSSVDL